MQVEFLRKCDVHALKVGKFIRVNTNYGII